MKMIIPHLQLILYLLLASSTGTILLVLVSVLLRSSRRKQSIRSLAQAAGIVTSLGTVIVSLLNVWKPVGVIEPGDEAKQAIFRFYDAIERDNIDTAYDLVARARIEEIRKREETKNWGKENFRKTYISTGGYLNKQVERVDTAPKDADTRVYHVSFDVSDQLPLNRVYELRYDIVGDVASKGLLNKDSLLEFVIQNLKEYYDVPPSAEQTIRDYIVNREFESLIDPLFLSEIRRNVAEKYNIELKPRTNSPSTKTIWRHFIQKIKIVKEDGSWKIREGLVKPVAVAIYPPGGPP